MTEAEIEKMEAIALALEQDLPSSIWGVSVGYREKGGVLNTSEIVLVFFADEKRSLEAVREDERVPKEVGGYPTDVRHAPRDLHLGHERADPLVGGARMTAEGKTQYSGTLGGVFRGTRSGKLLALTNRHVMRMPFGWGQLGVVDAYQPSVAHANRFGRMVAEFRKPDCAAIEVEIRGDSSGTWIKATAATPAFRITSFGPAHLDDRVFKVGATTEYTRGVVTAAGPQHLEIRPEGAPTERISDHGDSGSLWCREDAGGICAVGLHHSGTRGRVTCYAHAMPWVADVLGIAPL